MADLIFGTFILTMLIAVSFPFQLSFNTRLSEDRFLTALFWLVFIPPYLLWCFLLTKIALAVWSI